MRASQSSADVRASRLADALRIAAERREALAALKAKGLPAAGAEALCNGALRHAIQLSIESSQARKGMKLKPISRRQMDKVLRIISRKRFSTGG